MTDKTPRRKEPPADPGPQPEGVGATLRHRRQMRGQSLEAVYQATRIPRGLLQALEEDRFSEFPAPVYMRSFLKTYCEYLELEFEPLWQRAAPPPRAEEDGHDSPMPPEPPDQQDSSAWVSAPVLLLGGLLIVGLLTWGTVKLFAGRKAPAAPPPAAEEPVPASEAPQTHAAPAAADDPAQFVGPVAPPPADPSKLVVTSLKDGWVSLRRDGQLVFEGRLPAGKHLDYRGARFELHASDPAGLRLELGGETLSLSSLKPEHDGGYRFASK